jgi:TPP-dependent pyruvate/acetoin dehydrogenase alpha subunit
MHLIDKSVGMAGTSAIVGGAVPVAAGAALAACLARPMCRRLYRRCDD